MLKNLLNKSLLVLALISTTYLISCKKEKYCCTIFDNSISVAYSNKQGNDYLKAQSPESISAIKLYHLIDGKKVYYNKSDDNNVGKVGFNLVKPRVDGEPYQLRITLPLPEEIGSDIRTTAYLVWENGREDEIVGSFISSENNKMIKKFWYNKEEVSTDSKEIYTVILEE